MRHLFLTGGATPRMREKLSEKFVIHDTSEMTDVDAFLEENGSLIEAICVYGGISLTDGILAKMPNLRIISGYGVGYDGIPAREAAERGIMVTHTPDVLNEDVANLALLLMLAVSRNLVRDDAWARSGAWEERGNARLSRSIEGTKVGILGLGRIGETLARKLEVFNCEIVYHSRNEKPDSPYTYFPDLVDMAKAVDTLVIIVPGGAGTRHLVNQDVLEALGPEGTLINIGRGTTVDENALIAALDSGKLGAAGLDVFENEPHIPDALKVRENVVMTPHTGSATRETRKAMGDLTVANLIEFFEDGRARTPVPECRHLQA